MSAAGRWRLAGWLVLALGLGMAAWVYARSGEAADGGESYRLIGGQAFAVDDSAAQQAQTERMGGHALVMTTQFDHWLGSLWHGRRLAWTLGTLSIAAALACAWIAGLLAEDPSD